MSKQVTKAHALLLLGEVEGELKAMGAAFQLVQLSILKITYKLSTEHDVGPLVRKFFRHVDVHVVHLGIEGPGVYFLTLILDPDFDLCDAEDLT